MKKKKVTIKWMDSESYDDGAWNDIEKIKANYLKEQKPITTTGYLLMKTKDFTVIYRSIDEEAERIEGVFAIPNSCIIHVV